jgi:hypothetical protein
MGYYAYKHFRQPVLCVINTYLYTFPPKQFYVEGKELIDSKINVDRLEYMLLLNNNDTGISYLVLIPEVMPIKAHAILGCRNAGTVGSNGDRGIDIWFFLCVATC